MKILIIEDEEDIAKSIISLLKENKFEVDYAQTGKAGLDLINLNEYSCLIIDLNLPVVDGFQILKETRDKGKTVPVLILSARFETESKIKGFKLGVDDYLTKPFEMEELLLRIDALIRRSSLNNNIELRIGDLTLIPKKNMVLLNKHKVLLSNKETALLEYLMRNVNIFISTEELLEHVWDSEINSLTDTVRTTIKTLRKKIDPNKERIISVKGKGYMLTDMQC